jgi:Trypsin
MRLLRKGAPARVLLAATAGAALCAAVVLPPASAASGHDGRGVPGVEVAPGVYMADASELPASESAAHPRGFASPERSPRIVGGTTTTIGQWPWQAAITLNPAAFPGNALQRLGCGGSVVAPNLIISAAHCFFIPNAGFADPGNFAAVTGRTQLTSSEGQEIPFATYHVLTDASGNLLYNPNTSLFDAVLVELASPAAGAFPIKLAGPDEAELWSIGRDAFATGWGATRDGGAPSDVLRQVQISMISDATCGSPTSYGAGLNPSVMVCAGSLLGGQDACQGDSGGPLVVPIDGGGFRLVGDTSFGFGCGDRQFPGVYGRLGADPMRGMLQGMAAARGGGDIVGSGGQPPLQSPPETGIIVHPDKKTDKQTARLKFAASKDGSSFVCKLDRKDFKPCESSEKYRVDRGRHKFQVVATALGVTDPTPDVLKWKVKKDVDGGKGTGGGDHGGGGNDGGGGGGGGPGPDPIS